MEPIGKRLKHSAFSSPHPSSQKTKQIPYNQIHHRTPLFKQKSRLPIPNHIQTKHRQQANPPSVPGSINNDTRFLKPKTQFQN